MSRLNNLAHTGITLMWLDNIRMGFEDRSSSTIQIPHTRDSMTRKDT